MKVVSEATRVAMTLALPPESLVDSEGRKGCEISFAKDATRTRERNEPVNEGRLIGSGEGESYRTINEILGVGEEGRCDHSEVLVRTEDESRGRRSVEVGRAGEKRSSCSRVEDREVVLHRSGNSEVRNAVDLALIGTLNGDEALEETKGKVSALKQERFGEEE